MIIFLTLLVFLCLLGLSWFAGTDAPYIPTKYKKITDILKLAGFKKGQIFYELGSGDGRVVLAAAHLKALSFGIEQSWIRVLMARWSAKRMGLTNAKFYHGNIFKFRYGDADIVYIYMLQDCVDLLEYILKKELKKGAKVITQRYHFKDWKPIKKQGDFWLYQKT